MTTLFLICAIAGFVVAIGGLVLDGVFDAADALDVLPDWMSLPVLGAAVGAFGVAGLAGQAVSGSAGVGLVAGLVVGAAFAVGAARLVMALSRGHTDATPTTGSIVGARGRIVTPVPAGGRGEVLLTVGGHTFKLSATASEQLAVGESVVAIESVSDTSVVVMSSEEFWGSQSP